jgi:hypothetical protein
VVKVAVTLPCCNLGCRVGTGGGGGVLGWGCGLLGVFSSSSVSLAHHAACDYYNS